MKSKPFLAIGLFILAFLALLAAGAVRAQKAYLSRGMVDGLPEPINLGGVQPAINVYLHHLDGDSIEEELAQIKELGISTVKQPFTFQEDFDWQASDRLISAVSEQGLQLVPLLDGHPDDQFAPPADLSVFASWAGEFASRYGDVVQAYIIWDEPNLSSHWGGRPVNANDYAALLAATSQAIRQADPQAVIVAAPLAPTSEIGPDNLADDLYLQALYEAGAAPYFDAAAGKPYGFDAPPDDRAVGREALNFSRIILLREVMQRNGDGHKAIWAGNWGWNSLPADWSGPPSLWGEVDAQEQARYTVEALQRARKEWPWMGLMFLENWKPGDDVNDPRWGFSIADQPVAADLQDYLAEIDPAVAYPGFHLARPDDPAQIYSGGWRFSPQFGADISQPVDGQAPDRVDFTFWGTDVGLRVRRADFRARLYVTVDGLPANALPLDENGATLVLTSPDPAEDYITTEPVARNLAPGRHTMTITASRGWDQWALSGFSVGYRPTGNRWDWLVAGLSLSALAFFVLAIVLGRRAEWSGWGRSIQQLYNRVNERWQMAITAVIAVLVSFTGWLTWGEQLAGMYRRLGDGGQLVLTAAAASLFYVTPAFFLFVIFLLVLLILLTFRPAWGLALVVFAIPFYVPQLAKPVLVYRFSTVELFTLVTLAAVILRAIFGRLIVWREDPPLHLRFRWPVLHSADYAVIIFTAAATISLFFTERLDVATNELRTVILVPAIFYLTVRLIRPKEEEMWTILDAYILGAVLVALIGLWQYVSGQNLITAEEGLMRLRSIYGSPNNVALYLGRAIPLLISMLLLGQTANQRRRWLWAAALLPLGAAMLLTFSRGGLLLGLPAGLLVVFWIWQRHNSRSPWPWAVAFALLGAIALFLAQQVPSLAARLSLGGATGVFRLHLWQSSLQMIREHPLFGVGLDNFLYAYRGRYILDAAWQEPNLSHPHNIILDFSTRLGLVGLLAGAWMILVLARTLRRDLHHVAPSWFAIAAGFSGALAAMLVHGLVDHSFFLVDLAFTFYLTLGFAVWLDNLSLGPKIIRQP